jgi:hypothetical protein
MSMGFSAEDVDHRRTSESDRWCCGKEVLLLRSRKPKLDPLPAGRIGRAHGEPPSTLRQAIKIVHSVSVRGLGSTRNAKPADFTGFGHPVSREMGTLFRRNTQLGKGQGTRRKLYSQNHVSSQGQGRAYGSLLWLE